MRIVVTGNKEKIEVFVKILRDNLKNQYNSLVTAEIPDVLRFDNKTKATAVFYVDLKYLEFDVFSCKELRTASIDIYRGDKLLASKASGSLKIRFLISKEVYTPVKKIVAFSCPKDTEPVLEDWETMEQYEKRMLEEGIR